MKNTAKLSALLLLLIISGLTFTACNGGGNNGGGADGGVTLLNHSITPKDNPAFLCKVTGTARNDTGGTLNRVVAKVDFKDQSGKTVVTGTAAIQNFKAGDYWTIEVECPRKDFRTDKYDIEIIVQ